MPHSFEQSEYHVSVARFGKYFHQRFVQPKSGLETVSLNHLSEKHVDCFFDLWKKKVESGKTT
jgi:hypothetical protein